MDQSIDEQEKQAFNNFVRAFGPEMGSAIRLIMGHAPPPLNTISRFLSVVNDQDCTGRLIADLRANISSAEVCSPNAMNTALCGVWDAFSCVLLIQGKTH